jgi:glutaredoxin/glutathione-dependent peroxiredoxin
MAALLLAALAARPQGAAAAAAAAAWRRAPYLSQRAFSAEAAAAPTASTDSSSSSGSAQNVPAGHHGSDLSPQVCHIGLGRRRDLCLRQDLKLWQTADCSKPPLSVSEVFKGYKALLVGFPGGKVCAERHLPGYKAAAEELKKAGVKKVVCVTVADPALVADWAATNGFGPGTGCPGMELQVLADKTGGFVRMLGVEAPAEKRAEGHPPCFRYAAVIDDGVLLRIAVEKGAADVDVTSVASMLRTFREAYA